MAQITLVWKSFYIKYIIAGIIIFLSTSLLSSASTLEGLAISFISVVSVIGIDSLYEKIPSNPFR